MIYPCEEAEKAEKYHKMIDVAKFNHEELANNGRRNERFAKAQKESQDHQSGAKNDRPPWRSTGVAAVPNYDKGSKLP